MRPNADRELAAPLPMLEGSFHATAPPIDPRDGGRSLRGGRGASGITRWAIQRIFAASRNPPRSAETKCPLAPARGDGPVHHVFDSCTTLVLCLAGRDEATADTGPALPKRRRRRIAVRSRYNRGSKWNTPRLSAPGRCRDDRRWMPVLLSVGGHFCSLSPGFRKSDGDRLPSARDLLATPSALQCAAFPFTHRTFHRFLRGSSVPCHGVLLSRGVAPLAAWIRSIRASAAAGGTPQIDPPFMALELHADKRMQRGCSATEGTFGHHQLIGPAVPTPSWRIRT
jgi:hypothetical protein